MNGYVDLQVNGYAGVDFNADDLTDESLVQACEQMRGDGVRAALATIITAHENQLLHRIARLARFKQTHPDASSVIAGIHVEGPFISPEVGYVGAHPPHAVVPGCVELAKKILGAGQGWVRFVTLAPEVDEDARVTSYLAGEGVLVAAGHSNASYETLIRFVESGLRLFTHLGNGCPGVLARHENIIQRVLSLSDRIVVTFIADGHHIPPMALKNYLRIVPRENVVIVSDAMLAAGLGPGTYRFAEQNVWVDEEGAAWSEDRTHLAGSAATLRQMERLLRNRLQASDSDLQAWMIDNPARLLSLNTANL